MWFLLLAPKDRTHEERVSEFCTPDDEERKMKTRLKFDEFFSRLKLLILYPKWAILCASSSFLPLFFWNNNVSFKKFTSYIANLVMTNSRKNNFFLKLLSDELLNLYPHWSTESTWHDSTGLFWGCWYYTQRHFYKKKIHWIFFVRMLYTMVFWSADLLPSFSSRSWLYSNCCYYMLSSAVRLRSSSRSSNSPLLIDLWKQLSF